MHMQRCVADRVCMRMHRRRAELSEINGEEEVKACTNANIRSFTVNFYSALAPESLPPAARWEPCTPEFARNFTAVGYYFGRHLH